LDRDDSDGGVAFSDADADTHGDGDAHAWTDADADADADSDSHTDTHANANADSHSDAYAGGWSVPMDHCEHPDVGGELRREHVYVRVDHQDERYERDGPISPSR
jgi:hypothetical protein